MPNLYELSAKIVLDSSQYESELDSAIIQMESFEDAAASASNSTDSFGDTINVNSGTVESFGEQLSESSGAGFDLKGSLLQAKSALSSFAAVAGTATAVSTMAKYMWDAANATAAYGDSIDKNSQKIGISTAGYQRWSNILEHAGTNIGTMQGAMRILTDQAEKGNSAFSELGISVSDLANMSQEDLWSATISGLQGIESASDRAALASTLLGRSYQELNPLLNMSAAETAALASAYDDLGAAMSAYQIQQSAAFADAKTDFQAAWKGFTNNVGAAFLPVATDVVNLATGAVSKMNAAMGQQAIGTSLPEMEAALEIMRAQREEIIAARDEIDATDEQAWMDNVTEYINIVQEMAVQEAEIENQRKMNADAEAKRQQDLADLIKKRAQVYVDAYTAIEKSVKSYFGTFENVAKSEVANLGDMRAALQSQIDWNNSYSRSIDLITRYSDTYGISMGNLNTAFIDAGASGASYAAAIADAIEKGDDEAVLDLVQAFEQLTASQENLSGMLTDATGAFDSMYEAADGDIEKIKSALEELGAMSVYPQVIIQTSYGKTGGTPMDKYIGALPGRAGGMEYVPYHNYPALLHEGERVLTKEENKAYTQGNTNKTTINIYPQSLSESQMDYLARSLNRQFGGAVS